MNNSVSIRDESDPNRASVIVNTGKLSTEEKLQKALMNAYLTEGDETVIWLKVSGGVWGMHELSRENLSLLISIKILNWIASIN